MRGACVVFAVVAIGGLAHAEDRRIAAARAAYAEQEQQHAIELLAPALAATLPDRERASALRLAGCAHFVLGDREAALAQFRESFAIEPDAALETELASPDARSLFEVARGEWRAKLVLEMEGHAAEIAKLGLHVTAPAQARGGRSLAIGIDLADPSHLSSRVELSYRHRGQPSFVMLTKHLTPPSGTVAFAIPLEATESTKPFTLEYYVAVRHHTGFDLQRFGDPDHPHAIAIAAGHPPRWHELWWVRVAIGAGIVGLGAGGYLFYRSIDVGPQNVVVTSAR